VIVRVGSGRNGRAALRRLASVAAAFPVTLLFAASVQAGGSAPVWTDPTPADGARVAVIAGKAVSVALAASDADAGDVVAIEAQGLPRYARLTTAAGNPATAVLTVKPPVTAHGAVIIKLVARDAAGATAGRTLLVDLVPNAAPFSLVGPGAVSRWAYVLQATVARAAPLTHARAVARLTTSTPTGTPNLVLAVAGRRDAQGRLWIRVRLPILPNNRMGWVRSDALDDLHVVHTHLVVDRASLTATLFRGRRAIFRTRVGIGRPFWPTPTGQFYVREVLRSSSGSIYGPVAFGTSARSRVLTDWPGGGFIGIHGTNEPGLLPGRVSHGCVRMRNEAILRLARLMPLGTPVTIR
jgi:L,D-transpeptidase catalytic domain